MEAIAGGVDLANVLTMAVTGSAPIVEGNRTLLTTDGEHPAATVGERPHGNNSASNTDFKVVVVCAG